MAADEQGSRQGHAEVAPIEGHLNQRAIGHAHAENLGEGLHHRVGDVVGKAPQGKAAGHHDEREHITHALAGHQQTGFLSLSVVILFQFFQTTWTTLDNRYNIKKGCCGCRQLFRLFDYFSIILL